MIFKILIIALSFSTTSAFAKLNVLATTTDLQAIVQEVGGSEVVVESYCRGTQDPHFLEAKPSLMIKTNKADLVVSTGLGLEVGWLPKVLEGGRNAKVTPGQKGYLEVGKFIEVLEKPSANVTRADGDVHPEGNPHFSLDPIRVGIVAQGIAAKLAELDPAHASLFKKNATDLKVRLIKKEQEWKKRISQSGITTVVTYHKTLSYFLDRFGVKTAAILEPFPGVPPKAKHIMGVITQAKQEGVKLILVENYFDDSVAKRVARDLKDVRVESIPVAVGGNKDIRTLDDLYEKLVKTFEGGPKS